METERLSPSITNWNTLLCLAYSPRRVVLPPNSHEVILKATAQGKVFRLFAFKKVSENNENGIYRRRI